MSTITPPPATPLPLPTASPVPVAVVVDPPAAVAALANAAILRAEIVTIVARGVAEVATDLGNFQVRTNFALRQGAELELQLLKTLPQVQFSIRSVDGHVLPGQSERGLSGATTLGAATNSSSSAQTGQPTDRVGSSTVLTTPPGVASAIAGAPPPKIGSLIKATLVSPPSVGVGAATASLSGGGATGTAPNATAPTATNSATAATANAGPTATNPLTIKPNQLGAQFELRLLSVSPSTQSAASPSANSSQSPTTVTGTVTAFTPSGRPIVETPIGLLSLESNADFRIGNRLAFSIVPPAPPQGQSATQSGFLDTFLQTRNWSALDQAQAHLAQRPHDGATPSAGGLIPQANSQLGAALMSMVAALKDGSFHRWLGDAASILEREHPDLSRRLSDEFAQLARLAVESSKDDWRTMIVPFFNGTHHEPVQMHLRGDKSQKSKKGKDAGSRFIIDLQLSNLGRFQLDGFMKEQGQSKNFDLIVRTDTPLPLYMRRDINRIFTDFAEASGLRGGITFQAHAHFVEVPLAYIVDRDDNGLVV